MARPKKDPLIYYPMAINLSRAKNKGEKLFKRYLRNCASSYVKRPEVRCYIFSKNNYMCVKCSSTENLQIDHIVSVFRGWKNNFPIEKINSIENLQTLCKSCNAGKDV